MTTETAAVPTDRGAKRLRFERYVLDTDRGSLEVEGRDVALRPKTFAVLEHLVRNPDRLISKDELFAAVWPNIAITDDVLVQSVGELRRALGDDGPRLIKTIPRRGYRLEIEVVPAAGPRRLDPAAPPVPASTEPPPASAEARPAGMRARWPALAALALALVAAFLWAGLAIEWGPSATPAVERPAPGIPLGARPAIAILPLVSQSDDQSRDYFADGLTQDIINALGRFSALTVMSWNAVLPFKGKPARPDEIGRGLHAGYMVEGSVRQSGDRVRVNAQLVETAQGRVLWSARLDEALADVFALQDKITNEIVRALAVRVSQLEERRASTKPTENLEAYDHVLRARPALQRPTRATLVEARAHLRRAIELDPNYAAAYAALADTF
jgi:TolB-like protein/DNA-binding winged helix-turn-helix (wHTH) protein